MRTPPAITYAGRRFECPCCGGRFRRLRPGPGGRANACCPRCGSLERHRALALYLSRVWQPRGCRVLHFAPEPAVRGVLDRFGPARYVGADLEPTGEAIGADITDIPFEVAEFDLVLCSHVLEHVPDDAAAMREVRRVLSEDGRAVFQSPVDQTRHLTFESPAEADPETRLALFSQADHFRVYGRDLAERLAEAGFAVEVIRVQNALEADERTRFRLDGLSDELCAAADLYVCRPCS